MADINKNLILISTVSNSNELNQFIAGIQDGHSFLCIEDFEFNGTLNGAPYKRSFICGEIITYTTQYGFNYPALQVPLQFRAWVADNFYNKSKVESLINEVGIGKVKIDEDDAEADYISAKFIKGPGIKLTPVTDPDTHKMKLKFELDTNVAPYINPENKHWMAWDEEHGQFDDTGIIAEGKDGKSIKLVGDFELNSSYEFNDVVRYEGKLYGALNDIASTIATPDEDQANWQFLIQDGAKGEQGEKGDSPVVTAEAIISSYQVQEPEVRVENTSEDPLAPNFKFTFSGIKGEQGEKGETGEKGDNFSYAGYYESYEALEADLSNLNDGDFVIITQGTDKGKVYEIVSGSPDLRVNLLGPKGDQGDQGETGTGVVSAEDDSAQHSGSGETVTVTLHLSDGSTAQFTVHNGAQGLPGKDFVISKTYESIALMQADLNNTDVEVGDFVCITTGNVQDEDNAKLYVKALNSNDQLFWNYITDLSGSQGIQGPPGNGIGSILTQYASSSSGVTPPSSNWSSTIPSVDQGDYLWTKCTISFTDTSLSDQVFYSCARMGMDGAEGPSGTNGATWYTAEGEFYPVSGKVNDLHLNVLNGDVHKCVSSGGTAVTWVPLCNITGPQGSSGPAGPSGSNGADGNGIVEVTKSYQYGTSGTTPPTGTWSINELPPVEYGKYLWVKLHITYTTGIPSDVYLVSYTPPVINLQFVDTIPSNPVVGTLYAL